MDITTRTLLRITLFVAAAWLLIQTWDILFLFVVALMLALILNPAVDRLQKFRLPRGLAIILIFLILWTVIGFIFAAVTPPLVEQTTKLINLIPSAISSFEFFSSHQQEITREILIRVGTLPSSVLKLTVGLFSNLLNIFTTMVMTFYLLEERRHLKKHLYLVIKDEAVIDTIVLVFHRVENRLGHWFRGELILMFLVGLMTYFGLVFLGVDIALPLAIIAGLLELIPNIGPTLSAIPAVIVALTIHPFLALSTTALFFLVQFLENNFLVPKIMQKAAGVNPVISILGLMVGFRLAGPMGAILAIPMILILTIVAETLAEMRKSGHAEV